MTARPWSEPPKSLAGIVALGLVLALGSVGPSQAESESWWRPRAPSRHALQQALRDAVFDPAVYVPALGAGVIAAGGWDRDISQWAVRKHPIFGSSSSAITASDVMLNVLRGEAGLTLLASPDGEPFGAEWRAGKIRHGALDALAFYTTEGMTRLGKRATSRTRPNDENRKSFPSGHASTSSSLMTLTNRHLDTIEMHPHLRAGWKSANVALALGTAWARVEGEKHYPTDVLVGAALGRFLTLFIHDAWRLPADSFELGIRQSQGEVGVSLSWKY